MKYKTRLMAQGFSQKPGIDMLLKWIQLHLDFLLAW